MRIIGLTGGIASGKSTVAKLLESYGVVIIDADQLARELVVPGLSSYTAIVNEFGTEILNPDLTINRAKLGVIVFGDVGAREKLEAILHPAIRSLSEQKLKALEASGVETVVYMAPLLIEAGAASGVDEIWVVYVDKETQLARIMERDGLSREDALSRVQAQMSMEEKVMHGSVVIDNRCAWEVTAQRVKEVWEGKNWPPVA